MESESGDLVVDSVLEDVNDAVDLPFDLEDAIQCGEVNVLETSIPGVLLLLWLPEIDEWEQLDVAIVVDLVGTEMVAVVFLGPPGNGETVAHGDVPEVDLSEDVISLVVALVTDPASQKGAEAQAEAGKEGVGVGVPGGEEEEPESVADLKASMAKLALKMLVFSSS